MESSESSRQAADEDAQLPAYLRRGATDANNVAYDPWERYNRSVFRFNKKADHVAKWAARIYVRIAPEPVRNSIGRFYANLGEPVSAANLVLQGHPVSACKSLGRFAVNVTVGLGGLFDPATRISIPAYDEDFGQTLGHWGWRQSRYFMLPFLGPSTLRDRFGTLADSQLGPYKYFHPVEARIGLEGLALINMRAQILPLEDLGAALDDEYVLVREAWTQHRMHQIDNQTVNARDELQEIR